MNGSSQVLQLISLFGKATLKGPEFTQIFYTFFCSKRVQRHIIYLNANLVLEQNTKPRCTVNYFSVALGPAQTDTHTDSNGMSR